MNLFKKFVLFVTINPLRSRKANYRFSTTNKINNLRNLWFICVYLWLK